MLTPIYAPSLIDTEKERYLAFQERNRLFDTLWRPVYREIIGCAPVWGVRVKDVSGSTGIVVFNTRKCTITDEQSISTQYCERWDPDGIRTLPVEDLLLYINTIPGHDTPLKPDAYQVLKDRIADKIPQTPLRQDLVDRYYEAEDLLSAQYLIIGRATDAIQKYIEDRMWELYRKELQMGHDIVTYLHINGREYHWIPRERSNKLFLCPETKTAHICETDILQDEKEHPRVIGYQE